MMFESSILNYGSILGLIGVLVFLYVRELFSYWEKRRVPCAKTSTPALIRDIMFGRKSVSELFADVYHELKGEKYCGVYQLFTPTLVLRDPDIIKVVLLKNFESFHDRVLYFNEEKDPLSANLFSVEGIRWKKMRMRLNPGFTPSKMRLMFGIMLKCTDQLVSHIESLGEMAEIKDVFKRYTMDVIASVAFGIETNCLKDVDNDFIQWGRKVFEASPVNGLRNFINMLPKLASKIYIPFFSKEITNYFCGIVESTIEYRTTNNIKRNDFMQMMLQLKEKGYIEDEDNPNSEHNTQMKEKISNSEIAATAVIFFTAGFESTATSLAFCSHELAMNPDIQSRLYDEVCTVLEKHGGEITYDTCQDMIYMEMVISETLRKYPPGTILTRKCSKTFLLPESDNVVLEVGTPIIIPVLGLHHDPRYFPDPEKFDPERFSEENKNNISPYVYLPFGRGPRNCIASRFSILEMKVAITAILKEYEILPCSKTEHPLTFDPRAFVLCPINGMFLTYKKRM